MPAHAAWTRISSLAPNLRARAENCPRLPSQATSTTSDGEAATPTQNRMATTHASIDEQRGSAGPAARTDFATPGLPFSWKRGLELPPFVSTNSKAVCLCIEIMEGATVVPRIAVSEAVAVQVYRLFCDKDAPAQLKPKGMRGVFAVLASLAHGRPVPADPAATDRLRAVLARKQSGKAPGLDPALRWKVGQRKKSDDPGLKELDHDAATAYLLRQWDLLPLQFDFGVADGGGITLRGREGAILKSYLVLKNPYGPFSPAL